jgi:hypothetical protein
VQQTVKYWPHTLFSLDFREKSSKRLFSMLSIVCGM